MLYPKKTKNPNPSPIGNRFGFFLFGGRGWIRTTEAESSRFTVCPHWPLGNTPIFFFAVPWAACICYHRMRGLSTHNLSEAQKISNKCRKDKSPPVRAGLQRPGGRAFQSDEKTGQEKITSGSSCRYGAADRQCTTGSTRPGSADGRSPGSPRSSGCGCCSSNSGEPSFPSWRPR